MSDRSAQQNSSAVQPVWISLQLSNEGIIDKYTEDAQKYDQILAGVNYTAPGKLASATQDLLKGRHHAKILDVGAGTGLAGEELAKLGYTNVDAVEPSTGLLEIAKRRNVYKDVFCEALGDNELPIKDNTYDLAVMSGVMVENHLPLTALDELIRLVKPGGYIVNVCREESRRSPYYKGNFDAYMAQLAHRGKWKEMSQTVFPNYIDNVEGLVLIHQVL